MSRHGPRHHIPRLAKDINILYELLSPFAARPSVGRTVLMELRLRRAILLEWYMAASHQTEYQAMNVVARMRTGSSR